MTVRRAIQAAKLRSMRPTPRLLINTPDIELWPGGLLRARSNHDARTLARARAMLRRKRDGRLPRRRTARRPDAAGARAEARTRPRCGARCARHPARNARARASTSSTNFPCTACRIASMHWASMPRLRRAHRPRPRRRARSGSRFAGFDRYRRPLWLHVAAARAWQHMRDAALRDDVVLEAISGYRSHDYQLGIFERKLARGQTRRRDPRGQRRARLQRTPQRPRARHRHARRTAGRRIVRGTRLRSHG